MTDGWQIRRLDRGDARLLPRLSPYGCNAFTGGPACQPLPGPDGVGYANKRGDGLRTAGHARAWGADSFHCYDFEHQHGGLAGFTPSGCTAGVLLGTRL